jgi:hypothetical protein
MWAPKILPNLKVWIPINISKSEGLDSKNISKSEGLDSNKYFQI